MIKAEQIGFSIKVSIVRANEKPIYHFISIPAAEQLIQELQKAVTDIRTYTPQSARSKDTD